MLIRYPDYLPKFQCLAGQCPDTCCGKWRIGIDVPSLEKYASWEGPLGNRLKNSIDWENGCFLDYEGRCAFLNEENLCDLYLEGGKTAFCRTCRQYPRHVEEFENVREISLSLSCPAAMELILSGKTVRILEKERIGPSERYSGYDRDLYRNLCDLRAGMMEILGRRDLPIRLRVSMILALGHDAERRLKEGDRAGLRDLICRCQAEPDRFEAVLRRKMRERPGLSPEETSGRYMKLFSGLYPCPGEGGRAMRARPEGRKVRESASFEAGENTEGTEIGEAASMLLHYFLFTYLCGAVYDRKTFRRVELCVYLTGMIFALSQEGGGISEMAEKNPGWRRDLKEWAVRLSRQIEHEDRNLRLLEEAMESEKREAFSLTGCLRWADWFFS